MLKPSILKVDFVDFMPSWKREDNYLLDLLRQRFEVEVSDQPDLLFYSDFGSQVRKYSCLRIYYTAENLRPDFGECDYALTFDWIDAPQHFRLPLYLQYGDMERLIKPPLDVDAVRAQKTKFCNFVYSNRTAQKRVQFFERLSKYKRVDSGGLLMNNVGGPIKNKVEFMSQYKFSIAFENSRHPGYTTEKIVHPMYAGSIPIYWGNPVVERDFNPRSFLRWDDYQDDEALIERILELDRNEEEWLAMVAEPWLHGNKLSPLHTGEAFLDWFEQQVVGKSKRPVALDPPTHHASRSRMALVGNVRKIIGRRRGR